MDRISYKLGILEGDEADEQERLLRYHDVSFPGNCIYDHPVVVRPDTLKGEALKRASSPEIADMVSYYNFTKHAAYLDLLDKCPNETLDERLRYLAEVRWRIVHVSTPLIYMAARKDRWILEFYSDLVQVLYRAVDRFNPTRGYTLGSYLSRVIRLEAPKQIVKGNIKGKEYLSFDEATNSGVRRDSIDSQSIETRTLVNEILIRNQDTSWAQLLELHFYRGVSKVKIAKSRGVTLAVVNVWMKEALANFTAVYKKHPTIGQSTMAKEPPPLRTIPQLSTAPPGENDLVFDGEDKPLSATDVRAIAERGEKNKEIAKGLVIELTHALGQIALDDPLQKSCRVPQERFGETAEVRGFVTKALQKLGYGVEDVGGVVKPQDLMKVQHRYVVSWGAGEPD